MNQLSTSLKTFSAIVVSSFAMNAFAVPVLDQVNDTPAPGNVSFNGGTSSLFWQQEVIAGATGVLSNIELYFRDAGSIDFTVNAGAGWQTDADDFSSNPLSVTQGWNNIDVSSANISLNSGDHFVFGIHGLGSGFAPSFSGTTGNQYAGGLFLNSNSYNDYDINFRTYVDGDIAVSAPGSLALLGLSLLGLGASRRKAK